MSGVLSKYLDTFYLDACVNIVLEIFMPIKPLESDNVS